MRSEASEALRFGFADVTTPTRTALLEDLRQHLLEGRGFAVATVNLDHLVKLRDDAGFRHAYAGHTHVVADGNPVVWLHKLAGRNIELITGSDLIAPLMSLAAEMGVRVALIGSTEAALTTAANKLTADTPGLDVVACIAPSFEFTADGNEASACVSKIAASGARLCLVALGAPKQELFAARGIERLAGCGFISVGAGLDFIAGTQRRAPLWVRRMALEWLWRLASDSRRLGRRYLDCALLLPRLVGMAVHDRLFSRRNAMVQPARVTPQPVEVDADWNRKAAE